MKKVSLRMIGKVIYCYMLPAMGTFLLFISMFHRELDPELTMSLESDTLFKVMGLILCASTWFAAFQYWNAFLRKYNVISEESYLEHCTEVIKDPDTGFEFDPVDDLYDFQKVELDSPIKGLCLPFVCQYTEDWQKTKGGWGNGYVLISSDHPMSGVHYTHAPYFEEELTFSGTFSTEMLELCGINKDIAKDADQYWVFGFNTLHVWNNSVTHNEMWVRSKAVQLAADFNKLYAGEVV